MVHVRALVDVDGHAREVSVARSSGFELLDRAACDAVLGALFKPYRRNNVARSMVVIVPVNFSLTVRTVAARDDGATGGQLQADDDREDRHGRRRHREDFRGLSAAPQPAGEQPEFQVSE
jgi:TonB family protein